MLEMLVFYMVASALFIIIFFKVIRKNDTNYFFLLFIQAIGIAIGFFKTILDVEANIVLQAIRYLLSIVLPLIVLFIELKGINFSEIFSVALARMYRFFGNEKKAKDILVHLVSKYPNSYIGHKMLAEYYEKEGGMRRAIEEYVTTVDINNRDYKSYFKIANLLRDLGKKDEAIQMLENLIRVKPDCYEASTLLGELLCEQERFKEAANVYHEALKYKPTDYDLYYNLGIVYTRLSDFQMAKEMYERAAEINHRMYGAHYNLGLIAFIQKDYDTAERYFKNSLYGELEAKSYYQLARICVYKGDKDRAILFLNKAIELDPDLLKLAVKDKAFVNIKEFITVSARMNETEKNEVYGEEERIEVRSPIMIRLEDDARRYLEEAFDLFEDMSSSYSKQRISETVDMIFKTQKEMKNNKIHNQEIDKKIEIVDRKYNKELGSKQ